MKNKIFLGIWFLSLGCVAVFAFYCVFLHNPNRTAINVSLYENEEHYIVVAFYNYGDITLKIEEKVTGYEVTYNAFYISDNTARCWHGENSDALSYDLIFSDSCVELVYNGTDRTEGKYQGKYDILRTKKI
ncbi:MAG: hypothetical protein IKJ59_01980 [Clostridia bacterium]|nr:hypothetical protein [Clostridia bacterium]